MDPSLHKEIVSLETATWDALSSKGSELLPFLASDCTMLFPMGMKVSTTSTPSLRDVMTSEAFVPWNSYQLDDVAVTPLGPGAAAITYRVAAMRPSNHEAGEKGGPGEEPFLALIASVWRRDQDSGKWLLAVHTQTPFTTDVEDLVAREDY